MWAAPDCGLVGRDGAAGAGAGGRVGGRERHRPAGGRPAVDGADPSGGAVNPVGLNPQPRDAIGRARQAVEAAKARQRERRADRVPLPAEARDAISRLIADGTYARAVASVVVEDLDLSDS